MHIGHGRLALCELDAGDAKRPDVHLEVIVLLEHDFRGHPKGGARKSVLQGHCLLYLRRHTKVGQLDLAFVREHNVGCLDVTVNLAIRVEVEKSPHHSPYNNPN